LLVPDSYGQFNGVTRTDFCKEESGHDQSLEPTPHIGSISGAVWETFLGPNGEKRRNIISFGQGEGEQSVGGLEGLQRHGPGPAGEAA
jgi:hypothetical protein